MGLSYVGEIRMFGGNFAPSGWMLCDGQLLPISENETLFNLIGTTYGGDGQNNFALPDLRSRVPLHMGTGAGTSYVLAETGGVETVTLTVPQIPGHNHSVLATASNQQQTPSGATFPAVAAPGGRNVYGPLNTAVQMYSGMIGQSGSNNPHSNIQPYTCINFIISLFGVFPSQT
jgi:microcystin-dependent protein